MAAPATQTFEVKIGKKVYDVDAPDEASAWALGNQYHAEKQANFDRKVKADKAAMQAQFDKDEADRPWLERMNTNLGAGFDTAIQGGKQLLNKVGIGQGVSDEELKESRAIKQKLADSTTFGGVAQGFGEAAPTMLIPGGVVQAGARRVLPNAVARYAGNARSTRALMSDSALSGAATGLIGPTTSDESRLKNAGQEALASAGFGAALGQAGKVGRRLFTRGVPDGNAGEYLLHQLEDGGRNVRNVARDLSASPDPAFLSGIPRTAAQQTGDTVLARMELAARKQMPEEFAELARRQNQGLWGAVQHAGQDAAQLDARHAARAAVTDPLRATALRDADTASSMVTGAQRNIEAQRIAAAQAQQQAAQAQHAAAAQHARSMGLPEPAAPAGVAPPRPRPVQDPLHTGLQSQADSLVDTHAPGSSARALGNIVERTLQENPRAMKLYEMRKLLADRMSGPTIIGDEASAAAKGAQRETMLMINRVDEALDSLSGGAWQNYLQSYQQHSLPVTSARAQQQITEHLSPQLGPQVGGVPEITRHKLSQAIRKFEENSFGTSRLDAPAQLRYQQLGNWMQRAEEPMRTLKIGGTGGGGSQTAMQNTAKMLANYKFPMVGTLADAGLGLFHSRRNSRINEMLLDPQRAGAALNEAIRRQGPLSPREEAVRMFLRTGAVGMGE
jgi:hypothetical protein